MSGLALFIYIFTQASRETGWPWVIFYDPEHRVTIGTTLSYPFYPKARMHEEISPTNTTPQYL